MPEMRPKVSVVTITYNHEAYIEQSVRSILMQETNFDFEVIIGEDCSTDSTREILIALQKQDPERIRLILQEHNVGVMPNLIQIIDTARGDYIAIVEGDDYWTSPHKLQLQADYLDAHPECSLCFHAVDVFAEDEQKVIRTDQQVVPNQVLQDGGTYGMEDVLKRNLLPRTCSVMYRSSIKFPSWSRNVINGDVVLTFMAAQLGRLAYLDQNMASYRVHSGGISSGVSSRARQIQNLTTYEYINKHLNFIYSADIKLRWQYLTLALRSYQEGAVTDAKRYFKMAVFHKNGGSLSIRSLLKGFLVIYTPDLYAFYRHLRAARNNVHQILI